MPINYPGAVISVNHCYRHASGRKYLHAGARRWRDQFTEGLGWALIVRIDCAYRNENEATDPNDFNKLVHDAVQAVTVVNDRHMQLETGTTIYGVAIAAIGITARVVRRG